MKPQQLTIFGDINHEIFGVLDRGREVDVRVQQDGQGFVYLQVIDTNNNVIETPRMDIDEVECLYDALEVILQNAGRIEMGQDDRDSSEREEEDE